MTYNNEPCVVYKDVMIDGEKYTAVIRDLDYQTYNTPDKNGWVCIRYVYYNCELFTKTNKVIFRRVIERQEGNGEKYLSVIKEFCETYKEEKKLNNNLQKEENLALQELEEWDGIIK